MRPTTALVIYYISITFGYAWSIVQLVVGEPFDALVLFIITLEFQTYRNTIVKEL